MGSFEMAECWKECTAWLTRCGVLPPDHRANWSSAKVLDLAYTLRDGVQLCRLLNALDQGCVDLRDVTLRPQMAQFLCLRNIRIFLQACRSMFDLKESDLFEPTMLFDLSDFGRVLQTLSKLSNSPKALKTVRGFAIQNNGVQEEESYRRLEDLANDPSAQEHLDDEGEQGYYSVVCPEQEDIYQEFCYIDSSQSHGRAVVADGLPTIVSPALEKRDYICRELLETEKNYVEALNMIKTKYLRPLSNIMGEEEKRIVFFGVKELSEIHTGFHSDLCKSCLGANGYRLSDVFLTWKEKFVLYGDYCVNLPKAQSMLEDLCAKNELLNQRLLQCQQEANDGRFRLRDVLSVPMQRILKYHLLLEKLISETQESHEDYSGLQKALDAMLDIAKFINEVKRDSETLQIIHDIQASISDWDMPANTELKDYGRLLKDGELKVRCHDDNKLKTRYVFVFDQVMLMCKTAKGEQYSFRHSLRMQDFKVEDIPARRVMTRDVRWSYSWYLVHRQEKVVYAMHARTEEQKKRWMKAINDALENIAPSECSSTDHSFVMCTFDKPVSCDECGKLLKGLFFQGYRCSRCNVAVHKSCIAHSRRCGIARPPELPPRPVPSPLRVRSFPPASSSSHPTFASMISLPAYSTDSNGIVSPTTPTGHPPLITTPPPVQSPTFGYINLCNFSEFTWFMGEMERDVATLLLDTQPNGTFLLRIRPQGPTSGDESGYALSLKTSNQVKHMKIFCTPERDGMGSSSRRYYLSDSRHFRSIPELVSWYEQHSLGENFSGLDAVLERPFSQVTTAIALYDYSPAEPNQLTLRKGERIMIISKDGNNDGWWKGRTGDRIGYFPASYVREEAND